MLKHGAEARIAKMGVGRLIGLQDGFRALGFDGDSQNAIAVVVVDNKDVVVASAGGCHKFSSEVHVGLSGGLHQGYIAKMGAGSINEGWWKGVIGG